MKEEHKITCINKSYKNCDKKFHVEEVEFKKCIKYSQAGSGCPNHLKITHMKWKPEPLELLSKIYFKLF